VANFDKAIPPGGEGTIKLRVKTEGYQGPVRKSARVYTNDPTKAMVTLTISATVKAAINISPRYVYLRGVDEKSVSRVVEVSAQLDKALKLTPDQFNLSDKVTYAIEETEAGRKFQIRLASIPGVDKAFRGFLKLKTNYPEKPEITIRISGSVTNKHPVKPEKPSSQTQQTP
jgi:hypothetical protein